VAWGVWEGIGLVRGQVGEANVAEMSREGVHPVAPEAAAKVLGWLCGCTAGSVAVVSADWKAFGKARAGRMAALFRGLSSESSSGPELAASLAALPATERKKRLEPVIREALGQALKLAPDRIDPHRALGSMGLSSLLAMELRNRLERALGRSLPASLAFNYPTVAALVDHLAGADRPSSPAEAVPVAPAKPVNEIAELSEDEAMLALRSGRRRERGREGA
jgi:myxalamid-type polyketide synthase MxaE and MxaD